MTVFATKNSAVERTQELIDGTVEALSDLPENTLDHVSDTIRHFNSLELTGVTNTEISNVVEHLAFAYFNLPHLLHEGASVWRTRKSKPGTLFKHTNELAYPPKGGAPGRVAHMEQTIFYAASSPETAFAESRLEQGDFFHLTRYESRPENKLYLAAIGEIDSLRRSSRTLSADARYADLVNATLARLPAGVALSVQLVDAFYADWFGRKGNEEVYRVSNAITREFLNEAALAGVVYPSVEHTGGFNYAITASSYDQGMLPVDVHACVMGRSYGYGAFRTIQSKPATIVECPGRIQWPSEVQQILNRWRQSGPNGGINPS